MYNLSAAIFAGGKSSRMGQDKALLPFGDYASLSEFQYQKLQPLFTKVYLCAKKNKFDFDCPLLLDTYEESSPLVGIVSIFETLNIDAVFILSVDAPLVDAKIIDKLYQAYILSPNVSAVIAQSPHGLEPLCGIYTRAILPLAKTYLQNNNHKLTSLLNHSTVQIVSFASTKPFTNLNTLKEYQAILD